MQGKMITNYNDASKIQESKTSIYSTLTSESSLKKLSR